MGDDYDGGFGAPGNPADEAAVESRIVEGVRGGDIEAFAELVRKYSRPAFRIAYRMLGHQEDAEDLVQEAFLTALERLDSFDTSRPFGPWFYRILTNRTLNARRARQLRQTDEIPNFAASPEPSPLRDLERAEARTRLADALATLPVRQRTIIELFELEGFSSVEIGEILEISDGTVRWHLHQARRALNEVLNPLASKER